jgi:hypothetical protein
MIEYDSPILINDKKTELLRPISISSESSSLKAMYQNYCTQKNEKSEGFKTQRQTYNETKLADHLKEFRKPENN